MATGNLGMEFLDGVETTKKGSDWPKERPGASLPACIDEIELNLAPRFFSPRDPTKAEIKRGITEQTCSLGWYASGDGTVGGRAVSVQVSVYVDGVRLTRDQVMAYIARAAEAKHAAK